MRKTKRQTLHPLDSRGSQSLHRQVERGLADSTMGATFGIAQVFGLSIVEVLDSPSSSSLLKMVHGGDPSSLFRNENDCQVRIPLLLPVDTVKARNSAGCHASK